MILTQQRQVAPTAKQSQEQELVERREKRSNSSFLQLKINVGEEISFLDDDSIVARVLDTKNSVEFEKETYSVSGLAKKLLVGRNGWAPNSQANGWRYFTKDGITLSDLRKNIENSESEEE